MNRILGNPGGKTRKVTIPIISQRFLELPDKNLAGCSEICETRYFSLLVHEPRWDINKEK